MNVGMTTLYHKISDKFNGQQGEEGSGVTVLKLTLT